MLSPVDGSFKFESFPTCPEGHVQVEGEGRVSDGTILSNATGGGDSEG